MPKQQIAPGVWILDDTDPTPEQITELAARLKEELPAKHHKLLDRVTRDILRDLERKQQKDDSDA